MNKLLTHAEAEEQIRAAVEEARNFVQVTPDEAKYIALHPGGDWDYAKTLGQAMHIAKEWDDHDLDPDGDTLLILKVVKRIRISSKRHLEVIDET